MPLPVSVVGTLLFPNQPGKTTETSTGAQWIHELRQNARTAWPGVLIMIRRLARRAVLLLLLVALALGVLRTKFGLRLPRGARWATSRTIPTRPVGTRVVVDPATVWVDDGDTIRITWPDAPPETVRILGIDAPEIGHKSDPTAEDQPYGRESLAFARRHLLGASRLELLRAAHHDRFLRTLGYLFVDGVNYSTLAVENHMAECTIDRFGDSGFPREAAEVRAAERRAGPPPFESPARFRERAKPDSQALKILR
jgi:micrococcal nuclease